MKPLSDIYDQLCHEYARTQPALLVWYRMLACHVHATRPVSRFLKSQSHISLPGYDVLTVLARHPNGINMTQLARLLLVGKSNVTGIVSGLERSGLIVRVVTRADRRGRLVKFTAKGKAFWKKTNNSYEAFIVRLLQGIGATDRAAIEQKLALMQERIAHTESDVDD